MEHIKTKIYCLHGFLGLPSDWNDFQDTWLDIKKQKCELVYISYWETLDRESPPLMEEWSHQFIQQSKKESHIPQKKILLGYSMGGRLALHLLEAAPEIWSAAILISCHPGLETETEKNKRLLHDKKWSQRFQNDIWNKLMNDWENQSVFQGIPHQKQKNENNFSRRGLSQALDYWSLGRQKNFWPFLKKLHHPVLWLSGILDQKYCLIGQKVSQASKHIRHEVIPHAAHRVPWENSQKFIENVQLFLGRL